MARFTLHEQGITVADIARNLAPAALYEDALRNKSGSRLAANGALVAYSGEKTGRSPKDKRIVRRPPSDREVWWGNVNLALGPKG